MCHGLGLSWGVCHRLRLCGGVCHVLRWGRRVRHDLRGSWGVRNVLRRSWGMRYDLRWSRRVRAMVWGWGMCVRRCGARPRSRLWPRALRRRPRRQLCRALQRPHRCGSRHGRALHISGGENRRRGLSSRADRWPGTRAIHRLRQTRRRRNALRRCAARLCGAFRRMLPLRREGGRRGRRLRPLRRHRRRVCRHVRVGIQLRLPGRRRAVL